MSIEQTFPTIDQDDLKVLWVLPEVNAWTEHVYHLLKTLNPKWAVAYALHPRTSEKTELRSIAKTLR